MGKNRFLQSALVTATILCLLPTLGLAGSEGVGGGDSYSLEFVTNARSLLPVIRSTGRYVGLPLDAKKLQVAIETTTVENTNAPLFLNGIPKDALNYPDAHRIVFNQRAWLRMTDVRIRAAFALHEYLGILRDEADQYALSAKVPELLATHQVRSDSVFATTPVPGASKNYQALQPNDDGTITIVGPGFHAPNGSNLSLSARDGDSRPGICKLFGFAGFVEHSESYDKDGSSKADIDTNGKFKGFDDTGDYDRITSLICTNGTPPTAPSRSYKNLLQNDDGTFTIVSPWFGSPTGKSIWLSSWDGNSRPGICKLFGFAGFVENSERYEGDIGTKADIDPNGKFKGFDDTGEHIRITSLICSAK